MNSEQETLFEGTYPAGNCGYCIAFSFNGKIQANKTEMTGGERLNQAACSHQAHLRYGSHRNAEI